MTNEPNGYSRVCRYVFHSAITTTSTTIFGIGVSLPLSVFQRVCSTSFGSWPSATPLLLTLVPVLVEPLVACISTPDVPVPMLQVFRFLFFKVAEITFTVILGSNMERDIFFDLGRYVLELYLGLSLWYAAFNLSYVFIRLKRYLWCTQRSVHTAITVHANLSLVTIAVHSGISCNIFHFVGCGRSVSAQK